MKTYFIRPDCGTCDTLQKLRFWRTLAVGLGATLAIVLMLL